MCDDIDELVVLRGVVRKIVDDAQVTVFFYTESIKEIMEAVAETRYECEDGTLVNLTPKGLRITPSESRAKINWRTS